MFALPASLCDSSPLRRAVLGAVLAAALPALPSAAQVPLRPRIDRPAAAPGDTVTVSVRIGSFARSADLLLGVGFELTFDPLVFAFVGSSPGALFSAEIARGDALVFGPRLVRPTDDIDRDGTPDGRSYVAYSVARTGMTGQTAGGSGGGEVVVLRLRVLPGATPGRSLLRFESPEASRGPDGRAIALAPVAAIVDHSPTRTAALASFAAGTPPARTFTTLGDVALAFTGLSNAVEATVRRIEESVPGTLLAGGYRQATPDVWTVALDEPATFSAEVCVPATRLSPADRDPAALRVARRADEASPWAILPTTVRTDAGGQATAACAVVTGFSEFALATSGGFLPVELTRFTATSDGADGSVVVAWTTESETGSAAFAVEHRRADTGVWDDVYATPARGTTRERTDYRARIGGLAPGRHAFRLRQTDLDGTATVSAAVEATVEARALAVRIDGAPGPAPVVRVEVPVSVGASRVTVEIVDLLGRRVALLHDGMDVPGSLAVPGDLPPGVYLVRARTASTAATAALVVAR